jgi:ATP-dependent RNA helicase DeaD
MRDRPRERKEFGKREFTRDSPSRDARPSGEYMRLFVNLGTKDGFYKASFLQFILDMSELRKESLGRIDMREMNSWVEVDRKQANQMIRAVDGKTYKGRRIRMNDANSR